MYWSQTKIKVNENVGVIYQIISGISTFKSSALKLHSISIDFLIDGLHNPRVSVLYLLLTISK